MMECFEFGISDGTFSSCADEWHLMTAEHESSQNGAKSDNCQQDISIDSQKGKNHSFFLDLYIFLMAI